MPNGSDSPRATQPPYYFFLSHAHSSASGDTDREVDDFFQLLCGHLRQMTVVPSDAPPGFVDFTRPPGTLWPAELAEALAMCQVFVPLYSPRYFESEWCGREWAAFMRREAAHGTNGYPFSAIVPVLWTGVDSVRPPPCAADRQFADNRLGDSYKKIGLYGMKNVNRPAYLRAVYYIATTICDVAAATKLNPCDPAIFELTENAFTRT